MSKINKLIEYAKLVPEVLSNPAKIVEGVMNAALYDAGKLPQEEVAEIERRRALCAGCPYMSTNAMKNPAINYQTERNEAHCILCKCDIRLKTAALSAECGAAIYNKKYTTHLLPILWGPYKPKPTEDESSN